MKVTKASERSKTECALMLGDCLGIGNAAVAAKRCGAARFIGIELDEGYLSVASNRLGSIAAKSNPLPAIAAG